jgi:hypothetical protein
MTPYYCPECGWHPCRCQPPTAAAEPDWRDLERERQASGIPIYRVSWVCSHGRHDVPQVPYSIQRDEHPWRSKSYENAMANKRKGKLHVVSASE